MHRRTLRMIAGYVGLAYGPGVLLLLLSLPFPFIAWLFEPAPEWALALSNLAFFGLLYLFATGKLRWSRDR